MEGKSRKRKKVEVVGLVGVGLDGVDGHHRLTRGEHFLLLGGSEATHQKLVDIVLQFNDQGPGISGPEPGI